ncbi:carboxypeptidase B-like [Ostrinia nubilalis]|uniref:carboxypeptidase B-like n=1 Tax=Ostrinia nubilalis TaxID=29057 RepID=UPI0030826917
MARLVISLLLCAAAAVHGGNHEKYEGHQLYRVAGSSEEIATLEASLDILSATPAARTLSGRLEALVRLSPEEKQSWLAYFDSKNMPYTKVADNLAEIIRDEGAKNVAAKSAAKRSGRSISWDAYYSHDEINDYLDELGQQYPNLVTVINAGLSYEGRQIKYVRISTTRFEILRKPVIVIDAAVHAREWVTPPVALYIINQLVVDVVNQRLTDEIDWVIIPLANPDGYEYSIHEDRMWRKTRSRSHAGSDSCPGVDGNRNFDHEWGTRPESAVPCSLIYEGPSAFSEPEIRIIRDAVNRDLDRTKLYISLHSYGNMFLYAWGNNGTLPSNGLVLHLAGVMMAQAIDNLAIDKADRYIVGNAANVLYYSSGTSRDWTRAVGIPYTYTLELPGYEYGFLVPPEYTRQIVTETWAGIETGATYILNTL